VTGFATNLSDGRVEVVAEGEPDAVAAFIDGLAGEFGGYIRDVREVAEPPTGEFAGFGIRFEA